MEEKENLVLLFDSLVQERNKKLLNFNFFEESLQVIHSLKKQYDDKTTECNRLQNSLDAAHSKIITLYSQLDEVSGKYQQLLKNNKESTTDNETQQAETQSLFE